LEGAGGGSLSDKGIYPLANNDANTRKGLKPLVKDSDLFIVNYQLK
jgi:hypothetical protein